MLLIVTPNQALPSPLFPPRKCNKSRNHRHLFIPNSGPVRTGTFYITVRGYYSPEARTPPGIAASSFEAGNPGRYCRHRLSVNLGTWPPGSNS